MMKNIMWGVLGFLLAGVLFWSFDQNNSNDNLNLEKDREISSFEECISAGFLLMESVPGQCSDGKNTFTQGKMIPVEGNGGIGSGDHSDFINFLKEKESQEKKYKNIPVLEENEFEVEVSRSLKECVGVIKKKCLQVKKENSDWELFYDSILGFNYTEGDYYILRIKETKYDTLKNSLPQDTSSITWELKEIIKHIPKNIVKEDVKKSFFENIHFKDKAGNDCDNCGKLFIDKIEIKNNNAKVIFEDGHNCYTINLNKDIWSDRKISDCPEEKFTTLKIPSVDFNEEGRVVTKFKEYKIPETKSVLNATLKKLFELRSGNNVKFGDGKWNGLIFDYAKLNNVSNIGEVYLKGKWYPAGDMSGFYFREELEAAAKQFATVKNIKVYLNGEIFDWCEDDEKDGCVDEGGKKYREELWDTSLKKDI